LRLGIALKDHAVIGKHQEEVIDAELVVVIHSSSSLLIGRASVLLRLVYALLARVSSPNPILRSMIRAAEAG
jgi:hypothetical protein